MTSYMDSGATYHVIGSRENVSHILKSRVKKNQNSWTKKSQHSWNRYFNYKHYLW
jgi:hypothetical protein